MIKFPQRLKQLHHRLHGRQRALPAQVSFTIGRTQPVFDTSTQLARSFFEPYYRRGRLHEQIVFETLIDRLDAHSCFLDIGAHLGVYSILAGCSFPTVEVHAFEIDPTLIMEIHRNVHLNHLARINIVPAAAWESDAETLSFRPHVVNDHSTNMLNVDASAETTKVVSIRIDSYCKKTKVVADVAKIDVEGAEIRVLRGMPDTLVSLSTLLLEVHPELIARFGDSLDELTGILAEHRFSILLIKEHKRSPSIRTLASPAKLLSLGENAMLICTKG